MPITQTKNKIDSQQLQRECRHVRQIYPQNPNTYILTYWPKTIPSPFSTMTFKLKLCLSSTFPKQPPQLYFIDPIPYHLNVHQKNGKALICLLEEEWFEYIPVSAVIASVDELLTEPDPKFGADSKIKSEFLNDRELYDEKVQQWLRRFHERQSEKSSSSHSSDENAQIIYQMHHDRVNSSDIDSIREALGIKSSGENNFSSIKKGRMHRKETLIPETSISSSMRPKSPSTKSTKINSSVKMKPRIKGFSKCKLKRLRTLYMDKPQQSSPAKDQEDEQEKTSGFLNRNTPKNHISFQNFPENLENQQEEGQRTLRKQKHSTNDERSPKKFEPTDNYQLMNTQELESTEKRDRQRLQKISKYITAFMYECQCIEEKLATTQNSKVRQILQRKLEDQAELIEELESSASKIKKSLVQQITFKAGKMA